MRIVNANSLVAQDTTTSVNGVAEDCSQWVALSAQAVITTAGTGTLKIQVSNDAVKTPNNQSAAPTNWSDLPSATIATTGAGVYLIPKFDCCYNWVRLVYTATSGTGLISGAVRGMGF